MAISNVSMEYLLSTLGKKHVLLVDYVEYLEELRIKDKNEIYTAINDVLQVASQNNPYINKNGNWVVDGKDTGILARGVDGNNISIETEENEDGSISLQFDAEDRGTTTLTASQAENGVELSIGDWSGLIKDGYTPTLSKKITESGVIINVDGDEVELINGKDGKDGKDGNVGNDGDIFITSYIFKRLSTLPITPTEGSYENSVPTGWNDGIPEGTDPIWMSKRTFCNNSSKNELNWSIPAKLMDTNEFDVAYHTAFVNNMIPTSAQYPTTHFQQNQGNGWTDLASTNSVWMATDRRINGVWLGWTICKIKGEDGSNGKSGNDGVTLYTWIKYSIGSDVPTNASMMVDNPTEFTYYMGTSPNHLKPQGESTDNVNSAENSTVANNYKWVRIKGDLGESEDEDRVASVSIMYLSTTDSVNAPSTTTNLDKWSTTIPALNYGFRKKSDGSIGTEIEYYLWRCQKVTFVSGAVKWGTPTLDEYINKIGTKTVYIGDDGIYAGTIAADDVVIGDSLTVGDAFQVANDKITLGSKVTIEWQKDWDSKVDSPIWSIGEDGFWYKDGVKTNVKAEGEDGTSVKIKANLSDCTSLGDGYIDSNGNLLVLTSLPSTFTNAGKIQGPAGKNNYIHYVYCSDPSTGADYSPSEANNWIGIYVDEKVEDALKFSDLPSSVVWSYVKGDSGNDGVSITKTETYYKYSKQEPTWNNGDGWSTTIPTHPTKLNDKKETVADLATTLYQVTKYTYSNGNITTSSISKNEFVNRFGTYSTYISSDGLYTGTVAADLIVGLTITADQITSGKLSSNYIDVDNLSVNKINGSDVTKVNWKSLSDDGVFKGETQDITLIGDIEAKSFTATSNGEFNLKMTENELLFCSGKEKKAFFKLDDGGAISLNFLYKGKWQQLDLSIISGLTTKFNPEAITFTIDDETSSITTTYIDKYLNDDKLQSDIYSYTKTDGTIIYTYREGMINEEYLVKNGDTFVSISRITHTPPRQILQSESSYDPINNSFYYYINQNEEISYKIMIYTGAGDGLLRTPVELYAAKHAYLDGSDIKLADKYSIYGVSKTNNLSSSKYNIGVNNNINEIYKRNSSGYFPLNIIKSYCGNLSNLKNAESIKYSIGSTYWNNYSISKITEYDCVASTEISIKEYFEKIKTTGTKMYIVPTGDGDGYGENAICTKSGDLYNLISENDSLIYYCKPIDVHLTTNKVYYKYNSSTGYIEGSESMNKGWCFSVPGILVPILSYNYKSGYPKKCIYYFIFTRLLYKNEEASSNTIEYFKLTSHYYPAGSYGNYLTLNAGSNLFVWDKDGKYEIYSSTSKTSINTFGCIVGKSDHLNYSNNILTTLNITNYGACATSKEYFKKMDGDVLLNTYFK